MRNNADRVVESDFGKWFLNTRTWVKRVIQVALDDLVLHMDDPEKHFPVILDVGVGFGESLWNLDRKFFPQKIIALDVDPEVIQEAKRQAVKCNAEVSFVVANAACIQLQDNSVDMIFCHQTFHHIVDQESAIREFYRVLRPDGVLLFAESTRKYIHSWIIKWLFRHPMDVQKTADEYLALISQAGFQFKEKNISCPYLWWSRADLGLLHRCLRWPLPKHGQREETLLNLVATKKSG
jgi:ubiquinone/menaquinone biosynthesis C-methylase UbiE